MKPMHWTSKAKKMLASALSGRMLAILILGFSSGLPLLLIGGTLKAWLHDEGLDLTTIGFFALVGLPYTLKFVWSPLLDRYVPPFLDRRRGWIVVFQVLLLLSFALIAFVHPAQHTLLLGGLCILVAFFSASQDIAIDAYRREILSDEEMGFGFSLGITGYRLGMLVASAGALPLADQWGWQNTYLVMAAAMGVGIVTAFLAPKAAVIAIPATLKEAVINPFIQFFRRQGAWYILLFILLYKIGDQMATDIINPFYLDLGFTKTQIGMVAKVFGLSAMIAGGIIGGLLLYKISLYRALWIFGIFQAVSTLSFSWLAHTGFSLGIMATVVTIESLASGMGGAAFAAYMACLCDKRFTATQYALFSSLFGIARVVFTTGDGFLAKHLGWDMYFVFCTMISIPGLLILWQLGRGSEMPVATKELELNLQK